MKYGLAIAFLFFVLSLYFKNWQKTEAINQNLTHVLQVKFDTLLIDVGTRKENSIVEGAFIVHNNGSNNITIDNVSPDCHCTASQFKSTPIYPHDSAVIVLKYNSTNIGPFQSSAIVSFGLFGTDSTDLLILRGNVEQ